MTIAVATLYNQFYTEIAEYTTIGNLQLYCKHHDYKLVCKTEDLPSTRVIYFEKIKMMIDILKDDTIEWVWWIDCDALVTNFNIKLETIIDNNYDVVISSDFNGINTGSFLVKNSVKGRTWLETIYSLRFVPRYINHKWPEQSAVMETAHLYTDMMKIVPQKTFNSYKYSFYLPDKNLWIDRLNTNGDWTPGDFVIHFPGMANMLRIRYIKIFSEMSVIKPMDL